MDSRNYTWANSISSIITKAKRNLEKGPITGSYINDDYRSSSLILPTPSVDSFIREKKSFNFDNEDIHNSQLEFYQFKAAVFEKFRKQHAEIEILNQKYNIYDKNEISALEFKEDFNLAIASVEKRLLNDIRRLENAQKVFVTYEHLRESEEYMKNDHIDYINRLEISFRDLRSEYDKLPALITKEIEENLKNTSKRFLTLNDIKGIRENIIKNNENALNDIKKSYEEINKNHSDSIHNLNEDIFKLQQQLERSLKIIKESINNNENKILNKCSSNEEKINKFIKKNQEEYENLTRKLTEDINTSIFESGVNELSQQISKLPNFTDFVKKKEVIDMLKNTVDINTINSFAKKSELQNILDEKPNFIHLTKYISKDDLEKSEKIHQNALEGFKSTFPSKLDLEKIKKQIKQIKLLQNDKHVEQLQLKLLENEKSNDLLINKLVQLEQRVSLLEDSDSMREPLHLTSKIQYSEPLHSVISEFGSKETDSTAPQGSLSKKDLSVYKYSIEEFIHKIGEDFINQEIGISTEYALNCNKNLRKVKHVVPKLNFPPIPSVSPNDSLDELNNAVILNTDLTNKSESPIDLSLIYP